MVLILNPGLFNLKLIRFEEVRLPEIAQSVIYRYNIVNISALYRLLKPLVPT